SITEQVVIVLIDGLREDTSLQSEIMPVLDHLRSIGAWASMNSRPPSYSEPGYSTILTGAWPDINDGPAFNLPYEYIPTITQETIFTATRKAGLKTAVSAYYWFEKLIPQEQIDLSFFTAGEDREADRQVVDAALPWIQDTTMNLVLVHIDQVDYAGHHEGGAISPNYAAAAQRSDQLLGEIISPLDFTQSTLLVFSDHGQIDRGGHGGHDRITLQEPFVAVGKGIIPGGYTPIQMVDLASTVAVLLGTSLPSSSEGKPLVDMLELSLEQKAKLEGYHSVQQSGLIQTYQQALFSDGSKEGQYSQTDSQSAIAAMQTDHLGPGRLSRSILIGAFLGLLFYLGRNIRFSRWIIMVTGSMIFLLLFHVLYSMITGNPYSFSVIESPDAFILMIILKTCIAFLTTSIMAGLLVKIWRHPPSQIAIMTSIYTAFTMLVTALPAIWYLLLFGPRIEIILPNIGLLFLGMLSLIQVLTVGVTGIFVTGMTAAGISLLRWSQNHHK
ncbi:MAG: alkaline phosphatase family protein, partial [Anaerolineaceae bacterium]|nr:alkaline phosphatase family protein [Anaerolineaceae bacterium]